MNLWYDVSGLYNWEGAFTGIQRVVYNLGKEIHATNKAAKFFVFRDGNFAEISFEDLELRVAERITKRPTSRAMASAKQSSRAIIQHYGMTAAKQVVIGSRIEQPLRKTYKGLRSSYRSLRPRKELLPMEHTIFGENDTVVIVDGNWQFDHFDKRIAEAKKLAEFKLVHVVHDMVAVKNPAFANPGAQKIIGSYFEHIFAVADVLVGVSESTKRDIEWFISQHHIATTAKLEVLLLGVSMSPEGNLRSIRPETSLPAEFILSVSTIEIRKNYMELYYAYKLAHQKGVRLPHLVIAGRKGWMSEEVFSLLTNDTDINNDITIIQGPPDAELAWLYENCLFTVVPAFYEGWGLTVAESFAFGKACICSNTSSMPEVGGDMARYISPFDPSQAMNAISEYVDSKNRKKAEARIAKGFKLWTWSDSAASLVRMLPR